MEQSTYNQLKAFIWGIANDCLVNIYPNGDYRKIILPMTVIRRFDAILEPTKDKVLAMKAKLDNSNIQEQDQALMSVAKERFVNSSPHTLKSLTQITSKQELKTKFTKYLNGFSKNVKDIIDKFRFMNEIDHLTDVNVLGLLISKFTDSAINLSNRNVLNTDGSVRLPALDNHSMGTLFEETIRRFNEETNVTDAGKHFTPRDVVHLMAELAFQPVKKKITDNAYRIYDGACGTGGMLTVAEERIKQIAEDHKKSVSIHLYGQEIDPETYAIAHSDMLFHGKGKNAENIAYGSTISQDQFAKKTFDFMISNPPFGTPWKSDLENWGISKSGNSYKKDEISDRRFVLDFDDNPEYRVVPNIGDPQMLFLANNISKMKSETEIGSRIIEVHNGSSLFTGSAGEGESNLRRYILKNDLLEAIIAMPENLFYNTGIGTFIWILANKKDRKRKGKVQLIDATSFKTSIPKNLGHKNCTVVNNVSEIMKIYHAFDGADEEYSRVFTPDEFGYWEVPILRPLYDENGDVKIIDKGKNKGKNEVDKSLSDKEIVPFTYEGGIDAFFEQEVKPYAKDAWVDYDNIKEGYEISFTKYFYKPIELRPISKIVADITKIEKNTEGLLASILNEVKV
jgi:type I restriction enzyme M protein